MALSIDDRIGSKELLKPLRRMGIDAKLRRLPYGDFAFMGRGPSGWLHVGIERKTVDELLGAVTDSRFVGRQLPGLLDTYDHAWLLVEGAYVPDPASGILLRGRAFKSKRGQPLIVFHEAGFGVARHLYENVAKFSTTLQVKARLLRERTLSLPESVAWIAALYRWYQKPWSTHHSCYRVDESRPDSALLSARTLKRTLAAQLPGIGWERSLTVDQYFPSIAAMFAADARQWKEALHVKEGTKLSKAIVDAVATIQDVHRRRAVGATSPAPRTARGQDPHSAQDADRVAQRRRTR